MQSWGVHRHCGPSPCLAHGCAMLRGCVRTVALHFIVRAVARYTSLHCADNINVSHGQTAGMIDSLFTGNRLGHSADIAGAAGRSVAR